MNLSRFSFVLLFIAASLAPAPAASQTQPVGPANRPDALVQSVYTQVVVHHPIGALDGEDLKIFAPFLSKGLLHRMDVAIACLDDWYRQFPEPHQKPNLGWIDLGPFTGGNGRGAPQTFLIERTRSEKDGSFRVYVKLTLSDPHEIPWRVAAVVVREDGHFVVDDVIYLKDKENNVEDRLSESLSAGCDGPRWVGFSDSRRSP